MPIYEFKCQDCGAITEFYFRTRKDNIDLVCQQCHSKQLTKIISTPGAVYLKSSAAAGLTCCGSAERCDSPPCSSGNSCRRDQTG
ncbi:MAG: zinc ribbon domain-containing protein [Candidatus Aminicenantes bacterium]